MTPSFIRRTVFLCSAFFPFLANGQSPPIRIMPLGDSITFGEPVPGGYRTKLYQMLTTAGYNVDFVGNQTSNSIGTLPDPDHEGHPGWRIFEIDANIESWLNGVADPDVILLHIGTNDFGSNNDPPNAINRLDGLITKMALLRPYAHIIVTNLMEREEPRNSAIQSQFNAFVQSRVNAQAALGRRVTFLNMRSYVPLSEMPDQLHPNLAGYNHMADAWLPAIQAVIGTEGDNTPPAVVRALGNTDLTHVTITFSKPVADAAATAGNFTLSGGLTVSGAVLDANKRSVTLTTSPQVRTANYTATVNGVVDRTAAALPLAANSTVSFNGATPRGYLNNVPESAGYTLAYSLDLPNAANFTTGAVPYAVDNHDSIGPFSRVAYYLELQNPNGDLRYVWASADAFTTDSGKIGVPTQSSGGFFQLPVTGMNVVSNVPGITNGSGLAGNLEFWPNTYETANGANVAGASGSVFDFGDRPTNGLYGSMQLHNAAAGQTVFAFNNWGGAQDAGNLDIGIGNNPSPIEGATDWTFSKNAASWTVKTLQVLARTTGDTTAPTVSSAVATFGGTQVMVKFSEPLAGASVKPERFSLSGGVVVLGATLSANQKEVILLTTAQPAGVPLTLTTTGVRDSSPAANVIASGTTTAVAAAALPAEIVTNVGAQAAAYQVVASLDLPIMGSFNAGNAAYSVNDLAAPGPFTRVAYYMELQKTGQPSQYVWASMDAFTGSKAGLGIPTLANGNYFQQNVTNLNVKSNVAGVTNGTTATGGNVEIWAGDYGEANAIGIQNASASVFDTGDTRLRVGNSGYGCLQVHNHTAGHTVFALNNFGRDGQVMDAGIGNNPAPKNGATDWTFSNNANTYSRRVLHILVLPGTTVPPAVVTNVPASAGYQLAYSMDIPAGGNATNLVYRVNNGAGIGPFTRVAYYMELQKTGQPSQYVWTSMDAFTTNGALIGVPTLASGAFFQQKVTNLDVVSNVPGIVNGTLAEGGNIEFWPNSYVTGNAIGIPNASGSVYDFGDTVQGGTHGSMQVHNHLVGQTLFAFNNFSTVDGSRAFEIGIGNNPAPVNGATDWTFSANGGSYASRTLHVLVLPGNPDQTGPGITRVTPSTTRDRLFVSFNEAVSANSAVPGNFTIPGLTVTSATLLTGNREIALTTSPQTAGTQYTVNVSGVRDRSPSANLIAAGASGNFTGYTPPPILANIPETSGYKLVYKLPIPSAQGKFSVNAVPYAIDEARYGEQLFDRVAYLMELDGNWAYASFDRHTANLAKTGVPTLAVSGVPFQQTVANLNVVSNVAGVVTGNNLTGGNIEFWGGNYSAGNAINIPNASGSTLDFGDTMGPGDYGTMQIHNHAASQTIFAYNNFSNSPNATSNVGIGNNPNAGQAGQGGVQMPDWTFTPSASNHTVRNLYVLVRPGGTATGPAPVLLSQPQSRALAVGGSTTLAVSASGSGPLAYQWRFNGAAISGATNPWLDLGPVTAQQAGSYDVVVTGGNLTTVTSNTAGISVQQSLTFAGYRFTARKDTAASVSKAAILAKVGGSQGGTPDVTGVSPSSIQGGSVTLTSEAVIYTPQTGFTGADSFTVTVSDGAGGSVTGVIDVVVTSAGPVAPGQSGIALRTDGKVDAVFTGTPGLIYQVQRSTTLATWENIATVPAGDDGLVPFTDVDPPEEKAFYRTTPVQP